MKKIIFILIVLSVFFTFILTAQPGYYPNRPSVGRHNRYSNCSEPFAEVRFNRDYPGLSNTSLRYRDYEIRSYIRYKCLTSDQIAHLALLYATDGERERFLLYAFNFVFDLQDYSITASSLVTVTMRNDFYQFLASKGIPTGDLVYVYPPNYYQNGYYNGYPPQNNNYPPQNGNPYNGTYNNYPPQNNNYGNNNNSQTQNSTLPPTASNTINYGNNPVNNNNNNSGNRATMSMTAYENLKTQISQKSFEKERMELANQTVKQNILTANQIAGILRLLAFDNNRLDFAKFAYSYVFDKENYAAVSDALAFDSNKKALKEFLAVSSAKN